MKKWKIKRMSYEELGAQLKAVRRLLYWYQCGKNFPGVCQLCQLSRTYHPRTSNACTNCLWKIIEGYTCADFAMKYFQTCLAVRDLTGKKEWHDLRKPMLRRWAKIIQAERDCRTEGGSL